MCLEFPDLSTKGCVRAADEGISKAVDETGGAFYDRGSTVPILFSDDV